MSGTLFVVSTPIGNLEDFSYRAVRVLQEATAIACEDTRHTSRLLEHYGISKPLISYHEHNERARAEELLERLRQGENIALVSDAGTPLISDPGYRVVQAAAAEGLRIVPVPGASALLAALAGSGLATDAFYFGGFLPAKAGQRRKAIAQLGELPCVLIFHEAPHRLIDCLSDLAETLPYRTVVVARELTKVHEEFVRGTAASLRIEFESRPAIKGEITILVDKPGAEPATIVGIPETFAGYLREGMSRMDAMKATARKCGVSKREVYAVIEEVK